MAAVTPTAAARRIVSVLVADIASSTSIAEQLGPERSKALFDEVSRLLCDAVYAYGGTVAQLTGDGLLAIFGAPVAHEDDAERAVRAGLAALDSVSRYAVDVRDAYDVELAARVGVNTGPVAIGADGIGDAERYNALGDTVNVAARLQAAAEPGQLVLAETTAEQVEDAFTLDAVEQLDLRGRSAPVAAYRVCGERSTPVREERALIGRDYELAVLRNTLDDLAEGRGAVLVITGEPGVGKSRLVAEVRAEHGEAVNFVEGRAVSYAEDLPYWPVRELLRDWIGADPGAPEARLRLELKAALARVMDKRADDAYPFLAAVAGISPDPGATQRLVAMSRESVQHETFAIIAELVQRLAAERPVCIVVDDLHWADESTVELLGSLMALTDTDSVGLVLIHRSEREHRSWRLGELARQRYPHRLRELQLRPLAVEASHALAAALAGGALPDDVADLVVERSGGNPFFLEEALHDLLERGALRAGPAGLELAVPLDQVAIPVVVKGALQARFDRLAPATRDVLEIGSVLGRSFDASLVERMADSQTARPALAELLRLELLVEERRRPAPRYRFRHGLVQEAAYQGLAEARRRELHRRAGEALEQRADGETDAIAGLLGQHFAEADDTARAVRYLLRAGDLARALYANDEAIAHYRHAYRFLKREGDDGQARETLFKIALAHHLDFDFERAEEAYDDAFCCAEPEADQSTAPYARLVVAQHRVDQFTPGKANLVKTVSFGEHLFRGLLMVEPGLDVVPAMAESFRVSGDGLNYLFLIHQHARWSDGEPVTAHDFVYAWQRIREDRLPVAFLLDDMADAQALDERTLELRLHEPRNYFPYLLGSLAFAPWPSHVVEKHGDAWCEPANLVCNGPFALADICETRALLRANPYWHLPRGNVAEVVVEFLEHGQERAAWDDGRLDVLDWSLGAAPTDGIAEPQSSQMTTFIGFDPRQPPFDRLDLRRALALALEPLRLAEVLDGAPVAVGGLIPPALPGHTPRFDQRYDPERAARLLAEAGHAEGRGLPEITLVEYSHERLGETVAEAWRRLGLQVRIVHTEHEGGRDCGFSEALAAGGAWLTSWHADYFDPDGFLRGLLIDEETRWPVLVPDEVRAGIARARVIRDQDERMRLYHAIDRALVVEHSLYVPLTYGLFEAVRRPWVSALEIVSPAVQRLERVTVGPRPDETA